MIGINHRDQFQKCIIAQADSGGYDPMGWLAVVLGNDAALASFSHCSCYGTWESLCGGGVSDYFEQGDPSWDWEGTIGELVDMARRRADPAMPDRTIDERDYDGGYLDQVYTEVLAWANENPTGGTDDE